MTFLDFLAKMLNGNETARSMRYSVTVIILVLLAGYMDIMSKEAVLSILYVMIGYITGKSRSETHVIEPKDRRSDTTLGHSVDTRGDSPYP